MSVKKVSVNEAMTLAINAFKSDQVSKSKQICLDILASRPNHKGAKHLLLAIEHKVKILIFTSIGLHDPSVFDIGDFSYGLPEVNLHNQIAEPSRLSIGKYCTIGHDVKIYLGSSHRQDTFTIYPFSAPHFGSLFSPTSGIKKFSSTKGGVSIGNDVWIGAHSIILDGVKIGDGAVIAAGSVVSRNVGPYEVWAGNSATFRRRRFDEVTANRLSRLRWWEMPIDHILVNAHDIMSGSLQSLDRLESLKKELKPAGDSDYKFVMGYSCFIRYKASKDWDTDRPTWVVLHGSLGAISTVSGISKFLLETNILFLDIPGCGKSTEPPEMTVESIARELTYAIKQLISGPYRICGVSFGGALGLEIASGDNRCKGVVLVDTPMSAKKLWHNHNFLRYNISEKPDNQYIRKFALDIYGVTEYAVVERDYWYLLEKVKASIEVIVGDVPLYPERPFHKVPVCLDEDDLHRLKATGINVTRIVGGHDLIRDNPSAIAKLLVGLDKPLDKTP
jgi:acetyltransferase-like isoleucine patch superfamily enzyme/pimeloyl-ACP methyl ester carboxylesterase